MTSEQEKWLYAARFNELMEFCRSERSDEFFEDPSNSRMFFARLHAVIDEDAAAAAMNMREWSYTPLEPEK